MTMSSTSPAKMLPKSRKDKESSLVSSSKISSIPMKASMTAIISVLSSDLGETLRRSTPPRPLKKSTNPPTLINRLA